MSMPRFLISGFRIRSVGGAIAAGTLLARAVLASIDDGVDSAGAVIASPTPTVTCLRLPCPYGQVPYCPCCPTGCGTECVTPTPARSLCPGDCDRDGRVTVGELVGGVDLALTPHNASAPLCAALDLDGDCLVSIDEILAAVNAALNGC